MGGGVLVTVLFFIIRKCRKRGGRGAVMVPRLGQPGPSSRISGNLEAYSATQRLQRQVIDRAFNRYLSNPDLTYTELLPMSSPVASPQPPEETTSIFQIPGAGKKSGGRGGEPKTSTPRSIFDGFSPVGSRTRSKTK